MENKAPAKSSITPNLVGQFIRERRESIGLSQRALGQLFNPPVTTQFISNIERGVTPLPPVHIPTLTTALKLAESDLLVVLEKEYAAKISQRVGRTGAGFAAAAPTLMVSTQHFDFMSRLYQAYCGADASTQAAFVNSCEALLKIAKVT